MKDILEAGKNCPVGFRDENQPGARRSMRAPRMVQVSSIENRHRRPGSEFYLKLEATNCQFTTFQNASTYFARALR
jgi:hypothetical protein